MLWYNNLIAVVLQKKIESNLLYNSETEEYNILGVAYTGNNMRKRQSGNTTVSTPVKFEMKPVYHKYPEKKREKRNLYEKKTIQPPKTRC